MSEVLEATSTEALHKWLQRYRIRHSEAMDVGLEEHAEGFAVAAACIQFVIDYRDPAATVVLDVAPSRLIPDARNSP